MEKEAVIDMMETDEVRKRKFPDEIIINTCTKECKTTIPEGGWRRSPQGKTCPSIYMFYESEKLKHNLHVYELGLDNLSMNLVAKRQHDFVSQRGYAAYGSKLYAIGGEDSKSGTAPKDVNVFDLKKNQWEKGPSLIAGKPNPVVVVVDGNIYALSGKFLFEDDPEWDCSKILFEVLQLTPNTGEGKLRWESLPNPPFSYMYPRMRDKVVAFYTVVRSTIYFVLETRYTIFPKGLLYSFNVDTRTWSDCESQDLPTHYIEFNISNYFSASMASDVVDDVLYMCDADCESNGIRFFAVNLPKARIMPTQAEMTDAYSTISKSVDNAKGGRVVNLFWGFDYYRLGTGTLLPYLDIPLTYMPNIDPEFSFLVTHVGDKKFVVVCSYHPKCKLVGKKRVVYTCLLQFVGDGKVFSDGSRFPSDHAVILKESYKTMSSRLNVLSGWSNV